MNVVILQSYRGDGVTGWLARCRSSVESWADQRGYTYRFIGDELFDWVPSWYMSKISGRLPIASDLGRLHWIASVLEDADAAVWMDIDTLVFAPSCFDVGEFDDALFGLEYWLQLSDAKPRVYRNVHNAFCGFTRGSATLPFLIQTVERLVERVDEEHIPPQFVGPKLLTGLHSIVQFPLNASAGAISPLLERLILEPADTLDWYLDQLSEPVCAANLCMSLDGDRSELIDRLITFKSGLK